MASQLDCFYRNPMPVSMKSSSELGNEFQLCGKVEDSEVSVGTCSN